MKSTKSCETRLKLITEVWKKSFHSKLAEISLKKIKDTLLNAGRIVRRGSHEDSSEVTLSEK